MSNPGFQDAAQRKHLGQLQHGMVWLTGSGGLHGQALLACLCVHDGTPSTCQTALQKTAVAAGASQAVWTVHMESELSIDHMTGWHGFSQTPAG